MVMNNLVLNIDISSALQQIELLGSRLKSINLSEKERSELVTAVAQNIANISADPENRLLALSAGIPADPAWCKQSPVECKARLTRISVDTPDQMHYKVFCNDKELNSCIFADELGQIAVCYQIDTEGAVGKIRMSEPWGGHAKTVIHRGKIEIRRID